MVEFERRSVLGRIAVGAVGLVAGCSVSVGTMDLTIRNCLEETRRVSVSITAVADDTTVYDNQHDVPGDSCVDIKEAPVAVEDIITEAGTYRVRADGPEFDSVEETKELGSAAVERNDDAIGVYVEESGLVLS